MTTQQMIEEIQEKISIANLTEEEVALCFYQEMKKRIMDYIPAVFWPIVSSMIDSNADTLEFDLNYEKLSKSVKVIINTNDI